MPCRFRRAATALLLALCTLSAQASDAAGAPAADTPDGDAAPRWYTFGWPVSDDRDLRPRGGTSTGVAVTPAKEPTGPWLDLQDPGLDRREKDRRAILALAGEYRTSFDFVETVTHVPGLERARPYQSWATEYVFVAEDEPGFISLQHILVMSFVEDGEVRGPVVQKHWRQDWRHESDRRLRYRGDHRWVVEAVQPEPGTWTQTVHQVDDTPRYSATGRWVHDGGRSVWESARSGRPLPRREHTVRDDYDRMDSRHRITITPGGWTHEQHNLKTVLDASGRPVAGNPVIATEQGLARYTRIVDHDFDAGRDYWQATREYWAAVRAWWDRRLAAEGAFELRARVDGRPLFMPLFEGARRVASEDPGLAGEDLRRYVERTLERYVSAP